MAQALDGEFDADFDGDRLEVIPGVNGS